MKELKVKVQNLDAPLYKRKMVKNVVGLENQTTENEYSTIGKMKNSRLSVVALTDDLNTISSNPTATIVQMVSSYTSSKKKRLTLIKYGIGTLLIVYAFLIPMMGISSVLAVMPIAVFAIIGEWRVPWKKHYYTIPERIGDGIAIGVIFFLNSIHDIVPALCLINLPDILQCVFAILVLDASGYWIHYFSHNSFLWSIHKVHHSREHPTFWNASYEHVLDALFRLIGPGILLILLGFNEYAVTAASCTSALFGAISHLNIRLYFPDWILFLLVTPDSHRLHHHKDKIHTNCGCITHLWDHINGTYLMKKMKPSKYGLSKEQQITDSPFNIINPIKKK